MRWGWDQSSIRNVRGPILLPIGSLSLFPTSQELGPNCKRYNLKYNDISQYEKEKKYCYYLKGYLDKFVNLLEIYFMPTILSGMVIPSNLLIF